MTDQAPRADAQPSDDVRPPVLLRGTPVAPGLAMGPVRTSVGDLASVPVRRVPRERVEHELNRFRRALEQARAELQGLGRDLEGRVPKDEALILATHETYLKDSVFLSDVENLILGEQMSLEAAVAKVVLDFDRIFRLVQNRSLRERAVDLRDVGIRVLRAVATDEAEEGREPVPLEGSILVARELTVVDLFDPTGGRPAAVATEEGSLTGHAAMLARSLGVPTVTAVEGLLEAVQEGDFVIVDAAEGVVRVRPEARVREQFQAAAEAADPEVTAIDSAPRTGDGTPIHLRAACSNLPEVQRARALGLSGLGLYRTEVLYLLEREAPSLETLVQHYRAVLSEAGDGAVTFRLADLSAGIGVPWMSEVREPNPALGRAGVRLLLDRPSLLRRQLSAILRAAVDHPAEVSVAVPLVVDCGELRQVKEALFEERYSLRRGDVPHRAELPVGVVVETAAAVLGIDDLAHEAAFLAIGLDSLQQYVLAADRGHPDMAPLFERLHPFVLRAIRTVIEAAEGASTPLRVFGVTAGSAHNLPLLLGLGVRELCLAGSSLAGASDALRGIDLRAARQAAERRLHASTAPDQNPGPPDA